MASLTPTLRLGGYVLEANVSDASAPSADRRSNVHRRRLTIRAAAPVQSPSSGQTWGGDAAALLSLGLAAKRDARSPRMLAKAVDSERSAQKGLWNSLQGLTQLLGGSGNSLIARGRSREEARAQAKEELLSLIQPLQRGVAANEEDVAAVEEAASRLESLNPNPSTLQSPLINGKWKLVYTTSASILGTKRLPFLRPIGPIFQAIDTETLQARNMETWPFFNQVQATLIPVSKTRVNVRFDLFKILALIPIKAPPPPNGQQPFLETTYLDEDLRVSRGNLGNLFVLTMEDNSYRVQDPNAS